MTAVRCGILDLHFWGYVAEVRRPPPELTHGPAREEVDSGAPALQRPVSGRVG